MNRPSPNSPLASSPLRSSAFVGDVMDTVDDWRRRQLDNVPGVTPVQLPPLIYVKNSSGSDRAQGEVLQLGDYLITTPKLDKQHIWIDGVATADIFAAMAVCWEPIKNGQMGLASISRDIVPVKWNSADGTPAAKERWGVKPGEYKLRKNYAGYKIHRSPDTTDHLALAVPEEITSLRGKRTSNVSAGSSGAFDVYYKTGSSFTVWTDSTIDLTCECISAYTANKWAFLGLVAGQWHATPAEC